MVAAFYCGCLVVQSHKMLRFCYVGSERCFLSWDNVAARSSLRAHQVQQEGRQQAKVAGRPPLGQARVCRAHRGRSHCAVAAGHRDPRGPQAPQGQGLGIRHSPEPPQSGQAPLWWSGASKPSQHSMKIAILAKSVECCGGLRCGRRGFRCGRDGFRYGRCGFAAEPPARRLPARPLVTFSLHLGKAPAPSRRCPVY